MEVILKNKRNIFSHLIDEPLLQQCLDLDTANIRAQHIADVLDPQGAQENMDDDIVGTEFTFTDRHPETFDNSVECSPKHTFPVLKLKSKNEIHCAIRRLDHRQRIVFDYVARFVHDSTRGMNFERHAS